MKFRFVYVSKLDFICTNGKLLVTNFGTDVGNERTRVGVITQSLTYRMAMNYCCDYYSYYTAEAKYSRWYCCPCITVIFPSIENILLIA